MWFLVGYDSVMACFLLRDDNILPKEELRLRLWVGPWGAVWGPNLGDSYLRARLCSTLGPCTMGRMLGFT